MCAIVPAMRHEPCVIVVIVVVVLAACSRSTPAAAVEKAVRALYAGPLGSREIERDALRRHATDRLKGAMAAMDTSCQEILASDLPNHGLRADAVADYTRSCLEQRPLSCTSVESTLTAVEVRTIKGAEAVAVARVTPRGQQASAPRVVELTLRAVDGAWKIDEASCLR